jgi:tetratricopeptide (TPR) repeat protein
MKNLLYIFSFLLLVSCNNDEFLDELPKGKAIPETVDDLAFLLNNSRSINAGGSNTSNVTDDIVYKEEDLTYNSKKAYSWADHFYEAVDEDRDWNDMYTSIGRANFVIENVDGFKDGELYSKKETKARAHFVRAYSYFYLINGYAKHYNAATAATDPGVPMITSFDISQKKARSTVAEIYELIMSDLELALDGMVDVSDHTTYQSKAAAYALLGRIYLYQENYEESAKYSRMALDLDNTISDYNTFTAIDPTNVSLGLNEYIDDYRFNEEVLYNVRPGNNRVGFYCSEKLLNAFDQANDLRFKFFCSNIDPQGNDLGESYLAVNGLMGSFAGISVPEILLNYCEALMKKSSSDATTALTYLNMLRAKRYESGTSFTDTDLLNSILLERQLELRFSASRWFDMKRLGVTASRTVDGQTYTLTPSSNNYVWAIPLKVMKINDLLEQNPRGL